MNQSTHECFNDFVILNDDEPMGPSGGIGQRHMVVKYNTFDKQYYMRDLGDGSGTFIRVDNTKDLILKHGFIVS